MKRLARCRTACCERFEKRQSLRLLLRLLLLLPLLRWRRQRGTRLSLTSLEQCAHLLLLPRDERQELVDSACQRRVLCGSGSARSHSVSRQEEVGDKIAGAQRVDDGGRERIGRCMAAAWFDGHAAADLCDQPCACTLPKDVSQALQQGRGGGGAILAGRRGTISGQQEQVEDALAAGMRKRE